MRVESKRERDKLVTRNKHEIYITCYNLCQHFLAATKDSEKHVNMKNYYIANLHVLPHSVLKTVKV